MADNPRINAIADRLADELVTADGEPASTDHVHDVVAEHADRLADAPVQDFVPLLVENAARDHLHDEGHHVEPTTEDTSPAVDNNADGTAGGLVSGYTQADIDS